MITTRLRPCIAAGRTPSDGVPDDPVRRILSLAILGADESSMEDHANVEAWADALLERHRTAAGAGRAAHPADHDAPDREPLTMRLLLELSARVGGEPPDPEMLARERRRRGRFPTLRRVDSAATWIAIIGSCVLVYAAFSGPSFF